MTDKQIIIDDYFRKIIDINGKIVDYEIKNSDVSKLVQKIEKYNSYIERKEQECEELKEQIKKHNDDMFKNPPEKRFYCKGCTLPYISKKLKQTLAEIKLAITEISSIDEEGNVGCCYECSYQENLGDILQKISEVENESNI